MPPGAAPKSGLQRASWHRGGSGGDTGSAYRCQSCRRRPGGGWASMCTPRRPSPPDSSCPGARRARARESLPLPLPLLASPKLPCAPPAGSPQPELTRPPLRGNFGFGRAALRVPSGTGWGAARLPRRWRTTGRVGNLSGRSSGSWSRSRRSRRRRSCPSVRPLPALRGSPAAE